jgi:hypothetical protein
LLDYLPWTEADLGTVERALKRYEIMGLEASYDLEKSEEGIVTLSYADPKASGTLIVIFEIHKLKRTDTDLRAHWVVQLQSVGGPDQKLTLADFCARQGRKGCAGRICGARHLRYGGQRLLAQIVGVRAGPASGLAPLSSQQSVPLLGEPLQFLALLGDAVGCERLVGRTGAGGRLFDELVEVVPQDGDPAV